MARKKPLDIWVEYPGNPNGEIDKRIEDALKHEDYLLGGEGYHLEKKIRDLHFVLNLDREEMEKRRKEEEIEKK